MEKNRHYLTHYWRWQFLRLSPKYKSRYNWFEKCFNDPDLFPSRYKNPEFQKKASAEFLEVFGINAICDYKAKKLPEGVSIVGPLDFGTKVGTLDSVFPHVKSITECAGFDDTLTKQKNYLCEQQDIFYCPKCRIEKVLKKSKICSHGKKKFCMRQTKKLIRRAVQVVINLEANKAQIEKDIQDLIKGHQSERDDESHLKQCLKAYRYWMQRRKNGEPRFTYKLIAPKVNIKIGPGATSTASVRYEHEAVKDLLDAAKVFIDGGYRRIIL